MENCREKGDDVKRILVYRVIDCGETTCDVCRQRGQDLKGTIQFCRAFGERIVNGVRVDSCIEHELPETWSAEQWAHARKATT